MRRYRGRFAPTPSGPLHFGSMVAAVGSYLDAKSQSGDWLLRIDDLDPPRVMPGATDGILYALERVGLRWDEAVVFQSGRGEAYRDALERLRARNLIYPCGCSRKEIDEAAIAGIDSSVYPGTCRHGMPPGRTMRSQRVRTDGASVEFDDRLQGRIRQQLAAEIGDFVLWRIDGVFSYHLACAVDDGDAGITHVVRGADLIDSTPRQIYLQRLLGLPEPEYLHLPIAVNAQGEKLSKQTLAPAVDTRSPAEVVAQVLQFLGQVPPPDLAGAKVDELLSWAISHWRRASLPRSAAGTSAAG